MHLKSAPFSILNPFFALEQLIEENHTKSARGSHGIVRKVYSSLVPKFCPTFQKKSCLTHIPIEVMHRPEL